MKVPTDQAQGGQSEASLAWTSVMAAAKRRQRGAQALLLSSETGEVGPADTLGVVEGNSHSPNDGELWVSNALG